MDTNFILSKTGNFRSFEAFNKMAVEFTSKISSFSNINNVEGINLEVRGENNINSGIDIDYIYKINISGNNGLLTFAGNNNINNVSFNDLKIIVNGSISILSNVLFKNCDITVNVANGFIAGTTGGDNIKFDNCKILYNFDATGDGSFTSGNLSNPDKACILFSTSSQVIRFLNITIENCEFTTINSLHFPIVSFLINTESHYLENINIINNKFITSFAGDDKRSFISIISTILTTSSLPYGPRVININIENNIFDKNQMIIISATINGSNAVANLLVPINVNINSNICGSICYLMKRDIPLSIANSTSVINDKENLLYIIKNICKFIYCGLSSGFVDFSGVSHVRNIPNGSGIFSCSSNIENNICNWMHLGIKAPNITNTTTPSSILIINKNKIYSYDTSFLTPYFNTATITQRAIILDSNTNST